MALQSCLCHGSITHLKCSYGLATQMSVITRGQQAIFSSLRTCAPAILKVGKPN